MVADAWQASRLRLSLTTVPFCLAVPLSHALVALFNRLLLFLLPVELPKE